MRSNISTWQRCAEGHVYTLRLECGDVTSAQLHGVVLEPVLMGCWLLYVSGTCLSQAGLQYRDCAPDIELPNSIGFGQLDITGQHHQIHNTPHLVYNTWVYKPKKTNIGEEQQRLVREATHTKIDVWAVWGGGRRLYGALTREPRYKAGFCAKNRKSDFGVGT